MSWKKMPESDEIKRIKKSEKVKLNTGIVIDEVEKRQKENFYSGVEKTEKITTSQIKGRKK